MANRQDRMKRLVKLIGMLKKGKTRTFLKDVDDEQSKAIGEIISHVFQNKIPGLKAKRLAKYQKTLREVNTYKKSSKKLKVICGKHCVTLEKVLKYLAPLINRTVGIKKEKPVHIQQEPAGGEQL